MGLMQLHKPNGYHRLNDACKRALATGVYRLKGIKSILEKGLDQQPLPQPTSDHLADLEHQNELPSTYQEMSFEGRLSLPLEEEMTQRENKRIARLVKQ